MLLLSIISEDKPQSTRDNQSIIGLIALAIVKMNFVSNKMGSYYILITTFVFVCICLVCASGYLIFGTSNYLVFATTYFDFARTYLLSDSCYLVREVYQRNADLFLPT